MEGGMSSVSGKRKDVEENHVDDGAGSIKKLKRTLTQEHDLKVIGSGSSLFSKLALSKDASWPPAAWNAF